MTDAPDVRAALESFFASPRLSQILATTGIGLAALAMTVQRLLDWPGFVAAIVTLVALMTLSFLARRPQLEWRGLLPVSLLAFVGWATISLLWSNYNWASLGGLAYLYAFTLMAVFIAISRDTIQIVRAFGDVLRLVLVVSIALEIFSGLLIDQPIHFLGINGHIATLGPISGIAETRNQFGLLAIIGAVSFATEHRTRSVPRLTSWGSLALAAICIVLTLSPVVIGAAVLVGLAAAVIYGVRRVAPERRQVWQVTVLALAIVGAIAAWFLRAPIIRIFNADGVLTYRLDLWHKVLELASLNSLQGWGWIGRWQTDIAPFFALTTTSSRPAASAFNAYLDVGLQLGIIGAVIFVGMVGLTFVRSWLLAGRQRSVVYAWPAAVLVALIVVSLAESSILFDFGWLTFVICCIKASQGLSWRRAFNATEPMTEPITEVGSLDA